MIENMMFVMIFVKDQQEALDFYTEKLGFVKVTDASPAPGWRFLTVAPPGGGPEIILHVPSVAMQGEAEAKRERRLIGQASPMMFKVDDCKKVCDVMRARGVKIVQEPGRAPFGVQANIADLYGNSIWLIEYPK